jgi:long-subunit fatty acid transport protein
LTKHLLLDLTSNYSRSKSIGDQSSDSSISQFNRNYFTVAPGIAWEPAKNWQLKGSYVYRWQDYQQDNNLLNLNAGTSESNAVMFSLGYSWDGIRVSR